MSDSKRVALINLGDELLLGVRENSHLAYIGQMLSQYGLKLSSNFVLRDDAQEVSEVFSRAWAEFDIVITTGGLGPTSDDLTREAIANSIGRKLIFDPQIEKDLESFFASLGRTMTQNNLKQCYRPEGSEIIPNRHGTAPGIYFNEGGKHLFMLPGPTHELKPMLEHSVLRKMAELGFLNLESHYLQLRTFGLGESMLEEYLQPILLDFPEVQIAYCAHQGLVDARLSAPFSTDAEKIQEAGERCKERLGDDFVCFGNQSLARIVCQELRRRNRTLSVAESCTGGLLANAFTDIPGASKVFSGGVVCYTNDAKMNMLDVPESIIQQHGAVSAESAIAMVTGAAERFGSDYALSVTGFAGPGGGTRSNPVGTIYIGYYSPSGIWSKKLVAPGERLQVKARAVNSALDWMRRKLAKYKVEDLVTKFASSQN